MAVSKFLMMSPFWWSRKMVSMQSGRILYGIYEGTYVLKLIGEVRVPMCTSLDGFLERMFHDQKLSSVLIDLSATTLVDSTTLGLLAKIPVYLRQQAQGKPVILSTNPDVTRILRSMGFEQFFILLQQWEDAHLAAGSLAELPKEEQGQYDVTQKVIDAHRRLMAMNETNHQTFSDLVQSLETAQRLQGEGPCT